MAVRSVRAPRVRARTKRKRSVTARYDGARAVAESLQRYADRGVFRGLSADVSTAGRRDFRFLWLTREPMQVVYDPRASVLTFPRLVPRAASVPGLVAGLKGVVQEHLSPDVPAHRRVDARRARVRCTVRQGDLTLSFAVRGPHQAYAVQSGLNLVNRLFLHLQAYYPGYLIQQFGFSEE